MVSNHLLQDSLKRNAKKAHGCERTPSINSCVEILQRPKQRIGIDRESRSIKRVKTCPNGKSEPDSTGTSGHEALGDEPSIETSESDGPPETWLEDGMQNGEEDNKALSAETMPPRSQQVEDCVVLKSVAGSKPESLPTKDTNTGSVKGLDDGQVESAPAPRDINITGDQKGSDSAADARGFDCTTCGKKFFTTWDIMEHPHLGVGICRGCRNFLFSSPFTKSTFDGSEEQCRWCGEGGQIVMCDDCDKVFCQACILRNFGPKDLNEIVRSVHWSCYSCKPEFLHDHANEFKKFKSSAPSADRFPVRRGRGTSAGKSHVTRSATSFLRTGDGEGATIADLLAQEEERRRQNPGEWIKPKGKPGRKPASRAPKVPSRRKKAGTSPDASFPKQTGRAKVRPPTGINRQSTKSDPTIADIVQKAAAASVPPAKTYIRPHQWQQKRQQAAEIRRKRAEETAETERLKNVTNLPTDGHENNITTQAIADSRIPHIHCNGDREPHLGHRREYTGKLHMNDNGMPQVKSEYLLDSDVAVGTDRKVEKTIFYSEESGGDLMQTSDDAFGITAKNLFTSFTGVTKR